MKKLKRPRERKSSVDKECTIPCILPFINLRFEKSGAILFNPYLGLEASLDPRESFTACLFDGKTSIGQVEMALGEQFSLSPEESEKLLDEMFEKMSSIFALGFRKGICSQGTRTLSEIETVQSPGSSAPKDVTWEVTYKCNLRCPHCFTASGSARGGELNTEQAMAVIDQLEYSGVFSLLISGGEPLLRQDMPTLLQRLARTKLRVGIGTNGLEMPDNIMKDLIGLRDSMYM